MIDRLLHAHDAPALVDAATGATWTHRALRDVLLAAATRWDAPRKALAFLLMRNDVASIVALGSLTAAGHAVVLLDATLDDEAREVLVRTYQPDCIIESRETATGTSVTLADGDATVWVTTRDADADVAAVHPALALCLATSGSTGSPKLVRLSASAVIANATAIAQALDIGPSDRAITCLPLHYSYGLSLLTSHLAAGASIVVTANGVMDPPFWREVSTLGVTALAGVPYTYTMLERLGLPRVIPTGVRVMTQAGGKLDEQAACRVHAFMAARGGRFHVMYGQTEATARIAIMPHDWLPARAGAVGRAIPGGTLEAWDADGRPLPTDTEGEIVYRGPNVMLGYATTRDELALGDVQRGVLRTGDLGRLDADGALRITGRIKRMGKLFGVRVDLDAVERLADEEIPVAVIDGTDTLIVFAVGATPTTVESLRQRLAARLKVQQRAIDVRTIAALPRTPAGKVDYPQLRACA